MDNKQAQDLINDVLQHKFNRDKFIHLIRNLLNDFEARDKHYSGTFIPEAYREHINQYWRVGKYISPTNDELDILIVEVKSLSKLNTARTTLRNFAIKCLNTFEKDYSLIAFYAKDDNGEDWRFSFIKQEHAAYLNEQGKVKTKTDTLPARRYSFLVGEHENCYTACKQLLPLLEASVNPTLETIEQAFSIEKVTNEFFQQYKELYIKLSEHLAKQPLFITGTEEENCLKVARFAKKLLGQIVFLYFLQKKGWLGVEKNNAWGTGDKKFLSTRFLQISEQNQNYYRDFLQFLFYEALAQQHGADSWYAQFNCKIPFLNGGLFDAGYEWKTQPLNIPDNLFRNTDSNKAGDIGIGILDVFDRYNFTIKEDEPLEKEVAVDPEMLGKVFENMLDITERKSKGAFYTPREIVHYMCQESLIHYLQDTLPEIEKADIEAFIRQGLAVLENDKRVVNEGKETKDYSFKTPESIRLNAEQLDNKLAQLKICDPAIGSGAFPVGLLHEVVNARLLLQLFTPKKHTAYSLKLHCIQQSIYGVDLDASAVDISRLRLWLSLIVDYDKDDANEIKALPNLDYKIMQGNSLVENFNGIKLFNDDYINQGDDTETEINNLKQRQSIINAEFSDLYKNKSLTDSEKTQKRIQLENETKSITKLLKTLQYLSTDKTTLQDGIFNFHNEERQKVEQLYKLHDEFFACTPAKKQTIRQQISELEWELIEATLKERRDTQALEQIKVLKEKNEKPFFLWKLNFPEVFKQQGGFDIVIGNPPYIKEYTHKSAFDGLRTSPYYQGKMDLWYFFVCKNIEILRNKTGILTFIATNNWTTNTGASKMRSKVLNETTIEKLLDFGSYMVFESADIQTMVMMFRNDASNDNYQFDFRRLVGNKLNFNDVLDLISARKTSHNELFSPKISKNDLNGKSLTFSNNLLNDVLSKIQSKSNFKLNGKTEVAQGIVIPQDCLNNKNNKVLNNKYKKGQGIFVLSEHEKLSLNPNQKELKIIKPYFTTGQLHKWHGNRENKEWIIYTGSAFKDADNIIPYPHIKKHLDQFENIITSDNKPYGLHRARNEYFFKDEKIIALRKCVGEPIFTYTDFDCYVSATFYVIKSERINLKYLTAVLNSKLVAFWLKNKGKMQGRNYQLDKEPLLDIPIHKPDENQQPFINLVDYVLFGKEHRLKLQTAYFEQLIDGLVFELYFADELQAANKPLFKHLGELKPITDSMTTEEKRILIQSEFDRLYDPSHPIRNHLETLDSIEDVRIIKDALK